MVDRLVEEDLGVQEACHIPLVGACPLEVEACHIAVDLVEEGHHRVVDCTYSHTSIRIDSLLVWVVGLVMVMVVLMLVLLLVPVEVVGMHLSLYRIDQMGLNHPYLFSFYILLSLFTDWRYIYISFTSNAMSIYNYFLNRLLTTNPFIP